MADADAARQAVEAVYRADSRRVLATLIRLLGGTTTPAAISQGLTALLTGALLALCVRSFIDARRRRAQG